MYISTTQQIENPNAWGAFNHLVAGRDGSCLSAEARGLRAIKSKGLIVRYGNPFANAATEVLFESNEVLVGVAVDDNGAVHAIGKRHHTNASGAWKSSPSSLLPGGLRVIRAIGDELWIVHDAGVVRLSGKVVTPVDLGAIGGRVLDVAGTSPRDVYISIDPDGGRPWSGPGMLHFDGTTATPIAKAPHRAHLVMDGGEVIATGITDGLNGSDAAADGVIHRGTAAGLTAIVQRADVPECTPGNSLAVAVALGGVFVAGSGQPPRQLIGRVVGAKVQPLMQTTIGWAKRITGCPDVAWMQNGIELLAFDGSEWRQVPRALG
jgi:hypothetical protein